VRLADYPHPAADAAKVAEQRFRRELDRQLRSDVVPALRALQNASESGESDLTKEEIALAKRWIKASMRPGLRAFGIWAIPTKPISSFVLSEDGQSTCAGSLGRAIGRTR